MKNWKWGLLTMLFAIAPVSAERWEADIERRTDVHTKEVVALRHWFHANPELGNREFNTAARIAGELRALGFDEVREGIAHTGIIGLLRGGQPARSSRFARIWMPCRLKKKRVCPLPLPSPPFGKASRPGSCMPVGMMRTWRSFWAWRGSCRTSAPRCPAP